MRHDLKIEGGRGQVPVTNNVSMSTTMGQEQNLKSSVRPDLHGVLLPLFLSKSYKYDIQIKYKFRLQECNYMF